MATRQPVRAALALTMTAVGVLLVISFRTPDAPAAPPAPATAVATGPGPTPAPAAGASPPPSGAPTPTPGAGGLRDGTYLGQDIPNRYGDVQVKVVVSGGHISDVVAVQLPSDRARSAEISQQAGPLLHDEALQAQSAQIDLLSGATYTSDSYQQSLQSALDQAHR